VEYLKMKKMILALGVVASVLVLASCASKGAADQTVPAPEQTKHAHHDFKGEVK
jgi:ABC-type glycerol-3-phosphate transport system substrate-binding protein